MTTTEILNDARTRELIEEGAHEGHLSYGQINDALTEVPLDVESIEALLEAIDERGIAIIADEPQHNGGQTAPPAGGAGAPTQGAAKPKKKSRYSDLDDALSSLDDLLTKMKLPGEEGANPNVNDALFNDDEGEEAGIQDAFKQYLNRMGQVPRLSDAEEARLARVAREGSEWERDDARQQLAEANLRLVVSIARHYAGRTTLPMLDLMQEGNIGLMRAVDHFDPNKKERFGSSATWYIRDSIRKAVNEQSRLVRLPTHLTGVLRKLERLQRELAQDLGHEPSREELARAAGLTVQQVEDAQRAGAQTLSLDVPQGEDENSTDLGDLIAGGGETSESKVSRSQLKSELNRALDGLSEREKAILQMRFGVGDYAGEPARALEQVAHDLKLSRDRTRQLEVRAMRKLRRRSRAGALQQFLSSASDED